MFNEYCMSWPQEIKNLVQQYDWLCLLISNLEERIRKADTTEEANNLIDDLFFYQTNCHEIGFQLRKLIGEWNLRRIDNH